MYLEEQWQGWLSRPLNPTSPNDYCARAKCCCTVHRLWEGRHTACCCLSSASRSSSAPAAPRPPPPPARPHPRHPAHRLRCGPPQLRRPPGRPRSSARLTHRLHRRRQQGWHWGCLRPAARARACPRQRASRSGRSAAAACGPSAAAPGTSASQRTDKPHAAFYNVDHGSTKNTANAPRCALPKRQSIVWAKSFSSRSAYCVNCSEGQRTDAAYGSLW